jgi:hypothetical protein
VQRKAIFVGILTVVLLGQLAAAQDTHRAPRPVDLCLHPKNGVGAGKHFGATCEFHEPTIRIAGKPSPINYGSGIPGGTMSIQQSANAFCVDAGFSSSSSFRRGPDKAEAYDYESHSVISGVGRQAFGEITCA